MSKQYVPQAATVVQYDIGKVDGAVPDSNGVTPFYPRAHGTNIITDGQLVMMTPNNGGVIAALNGLGRKTTGKKSKSQALALQLMYPVIGVALVNDGDRTRKPGDPSAMGGKMSVQIGGTKTVTNNSDQTIQVGQLLRARYPDPEDDEIEKTHGKRSMTHNLPHGLIVPIIEPWKPTNGELLRDVGHDVCTDSKTFAEIFGGARYSTELYELFHRWVNNMSVVGILLLRILAQHGIISFTRRVTDSTSASHLPMTDSSNIAELRDFDTNANNATLAECIDGSNDALAINADCIAGIVAHILGVANTRDMISPTPRSSFAFNPASDDSNKLTNLIRAEFVGALFSSDEFHNTQIGQRATGNNIGRNANSKILDNVHGTLLSKQLGLFPSIFRDVNKIVELDKTSIIGKSVDCASPGSQMQIFLNGSGLA